MIDFSSSHIQRQPGSMDTWFDHPLAVKFFKDLVLEQYVDATFERLPARNYWQLPYVDLKLSSNGQVTIINDFLTSNPFFFSRMFANSYWETISYLQCVTKKFIEHLIIY